MDRQNLFNITIVFIFCIIFFSTIQFSTHNLIGYDAYANIKTAYLYRTEGILYEFPWMYYTISRDNFADNQFLFHLLLIPFTFGNLIFGGKIAIIIFASLSITVFYWFLRKYNIVWPFFWTAILLTSQMFIFRVSMIRPFSISVLFLILGIHFTISRKYKRLFFLSMFYSLLHGTFFILSIFIVCYLLVRYLKKEKITFALLFYNLSGIFLGLFINPFFPKNIYTFYLIHIRGIIGSTSPVDAAAEWLPINHMFFIKDAYLMMILFLISFGSFLFYKKNQNKYSFLFLITSLVFFILTLSYRRFEIYWSVVTVMFCSFTLNNNLKKWTECQSFSSLFNKGLRRSKKLPVKKYICFLIIIITIFLFSFSLYANKKGLSEWDNINNYYNCSNWIKNNVQKNANIFIMNWPQFSPLFFYNHDQRYTLGLDEYRMYLYEKELYFKYVNVTRGTLKNPDKIKRIIKEDFNSSYIFFDDHDWIVRNSYFYDLINKDDNFKKEYRDRYCSVYKIK